LGKTAAAGILIALVAGMFIGYLALPYIFPTQGHTSTHQYYVSQRNDLVALPGSWYTIPNLTISYTTETGNSVLYSYVCECSFELSTTPPANLIIYFRIVVDGQFVQTSYLIFYLQTTVSTTLSHVTRYYKTDLTPGFHNVTIMAYHTTAPVVASSVILEHHVLTVEIL